MDPETLAAHFSDMKQQEMAVNLLIDDTLLYTDPGFWGWILRPYTMHYAPHG